MKWCFFIPVFFLLHTAETSAQSIGFDFETWNADSTLPGWASSGFGAARTNNAHTGNHAVSVWNWYYYGKGFYTNDAQSTGVPFLQDFPLHRGQPISFRPSGVSGYYRYEAGDNQGQNDSAWIRITLTRYNSLTQQTDSVGKGLIFLGFAQNYQPFFVPVEYYTAAMPDSFCLSLVSSKNGFCNSSGNGECLYLTVDDLSLGTSTGEKMRMANLPEATFDGQSILLRGYPNNMLTLHNIFGQVCLQQFLKESEETISISHLAPGMYIASFAGYNKMPAVKFLKTSD